MDRSNVEILIHISAPSRAADDARYRSLAASYIDFQPTTRLDLLKHVSSPIGSSGSQETQLNTIHDVLASSQPSELLGSFKSPQASFKSVLDNAGSPRVFTRHTLEHELVSTAEESSTSMIQSPWQTPSSMVQDSFLGIPTNNTTLTSPTRVLEHYLQRFDSPSTSPIPASQRSIDIGPYSGSSQSTIHPNSENRQAIPPFPSTPPVVPCTPQCDPASSSEGLARTNPRGGHMQHQQDAPPVSDEMTSDTVVEETVIVSSNPSSVVRAGSEPLPSKLRQTNALCRAASDIGPRASSAQKPVLTVVFLSEHGYTYESLELRAPDPPVSVAHVEPNDLITPGLERLARDPNIPKRYRPKESKRDLRPSERGYWLVDCSTWDLQLKRNAWAYLANYVGTGVAGWGVWCRRDVEFRQIRVYCWGLVAAHVYLLLYLASQGRILYTGGSWIDSEGIPIIVMQTRD